jgi:four helix bundle protein
MPHSTFTTHGYQKLIVWQKAMQLVCTIYEISKAFPSEERYGLVSQMRRCAISIPSNIAEGRRRGTRADYAHFLRIAFGSGAELETQIEICKRLSHLQHISFIQSESLLDEIMRMLNAFIVRLNPQHQNSTKLPS